MTGLNLKNSRAILAAVVITGLIVLAHLTTPGAPLASSPSSKPPKDMVYVPEGAFTMGSNERLPDEGPKHQVFVPAFFLDKYEVTNAKYLQFVRATQRKPPIYWRDGMPPPDKSQHPVVFVTWYDGNAFCHWKGKRLPSMAEWEKAARGKDERTYPWGDEFDASKANTPYTKRRDTTPVGSFESGKSPYGVYDMSGNVWEWTSNWYKAYPGNKRRRLMTYGHLYRVLKGGSFVDCSIYHCGISAPVFNRSFFKPETRNNSFGFRCAKSA